MNGAAQLRTWKLLRCSFWALSFSFWSREIPATRSANAERSRQSVRRLMADQKF
jgi:hypothetical protein